MELDLRGQRAEDALDALDRYLDSTVMAGLPFVRITHGKGTGKLRQAIREALQELGVSRQLQSGRLSPKFRTELLIFINHPLCEDGIERRIFLGLY